MRSGWLRVVAGVAAVAGWWCAALGLVAGAPRTAAAQAAVGSIRLVPVVQRGLAAPLFVTHAGDGSGRLFVVEQAGRVRILANGALVRRPFLDIAGRVLAGGERGLLGLAFHPRFRTNGRFFVNYTRRPDGATVVSEFRVSGNPGVAQPAERVLLAVPQPFANHNGGMLAFGRSGDLFIGLGDGGGVGDPGNRAQDRRSLLGKILRVGVDGARPYAIPADNPFARGGGGRREIYALGFRNPWRFSFDRRTGQLWVGDVGQEVVEEIDVVRRGGNHGWRVTEGNSCFNPAAGCSRAGLARPVATYAHTGGRCSITGGYVYRGRDIPSLNGTYVYADFCTGEIFGLRGGRSARLRDTSLAIVSFGEDQAGELLVVDLAGGVHRVARAGP